MTIIMLYLHKIFIECETQKKFYKEKFLKLIKLK